MDKSFRSRIVVCPAQANPVLLTHTLFDAAHQESGDSPITEFLKRLEELNKLAPQPGNFDPYQGQLVLLGVVAAVESFLRALLRRIISSDDVSRDLVHDRDVAYGAALYLTEELLPEAILERIAFVSEKSIVSALNDLLGVKNVPADLKSAINDYARICQLRHCAVHRFGKLGVKNAIQLGLVEHKEILEKPLHLNYVALQNVIAIATGLVKSINNFLFNEILCRVPDSQWVGKYTKDRVVFGKCYKLFADKVSVIRTPPPNAVYKQFMRQRADFSASR